VTIDASQTRAATRQHRPLLAWYGDDVTGSTDVLEALGSAGVPAVLFLAPPSPERLTAAFPGRTAVGVAGLARSLPTPEIPVEIEPVLRALHALEPALVHYKVCSTFDSSPDVGSIGAAIDTAWPIFGPDWVPVLVAAPSLGRYTAFGTHFARYADAVYRLDRHPVMARHPVTPMHEPDLRRHLALQTDRPIGLVDIRALLGGPKAADSALDAELEAGRHVVVLDGVDAASVAAAARLAWDRRPADRPAFAVGSSGLEPGLVAAWRDDGLLADRDATHAPIRPPFGPVLVASGSGSQWTERQIACAVDAGWAPVAWDTQRFLRDPDVTIAAVTEAAADALHSGRNVVVHSALGPDDPRIERTRGAAAELGLTDRALARRLGDGLGRIVRSLVGPGGPGRVVIAGGDASGWAARALGVEALDYVGSFDPGVPLTRATGDGAVDGLDLVLKSGQLGAEDLLVRVATR
jgi:3-oxoisoapionate kinase